MNRFHSPTSTTLNDLFYLVLLTIFTLIHIQQFLMAPMILASSSTASQRTRRKQQRQRRRRYEKKRQAKF